MLSFLLFMYLSFGRPTDYFLSFLHLPFLFSIGALVLCVITRGAERAFQTRIAISMLGFTFWMAACIPFSVWRGGSWATLSGQWTKSLLVFFLVAGMMITIDDVKRLMTTLALASATIVALSFRYKVQGGDGRSY